MCSTAAHMVDVAVEQVRMGGGVGKLGRFGAGDTPSPAHVRLLLEAEAGVLPNRVAKDLSEKASNRSGPGQAAGGQSSPRLGGLPM
jgi:hypothetical protein